MPQLDEAELIARDSLVKAKFAARVKEFSGMSWEQRFETILHDLLHFGLKLLVVAAIFFVGRWLIRRIIRMIGNIFERRGVDPSLRTFLKSVVRILLYCVLFYIIISYLGINTTLFIAVFTAAGLAIGMALSGVFQNFAGGMMILLLKPFRVGDWIEIQGQSGTVMDIRLFNTVLRTGDNKTIILPNGSVSTSIVNNYNTARTRRVEWIVGLSYGTDFAMTHEIFTELLAGEKRILTTPAPLVALSNLGSGSLEVTLRAWVKSSDYWGVYYDINASIYSLVPDRGLSFPTSKIDVNLLPSSPKK